MRLHGFRTRPLFAVASLFALLALGARSAPAHVVTTKDGKTYEGKVLSQDADHVVIETTFDGVKDLPRAQVVSVDTGTPPLREQFAFRLADAKSDLRALLDVADWAKRMKFGKEIEEVWKKILAVDPANSRAHKALGHVKVGNQWMTPEEKAAADKAAEEAALRAKGLVPYEGRWVTPEEKDALEKGLVKDGDEWVTEETYHKRRGEQKVNGQWIKVGEAEGKALAQAISKSVEVTMTALWSPHVDLITELEPAQSNEVLEAAEKTVMAFHRLVKLPAEDKLASLRIPVVCFVKVPAYARYAQVFAEENKIAQRFPNMENWPQQVKGQPSFWWVDPPTTAHYLFPNTTKRLASGVSHNLGAILLTKWKFNWRFSSWWLQEGLSYVLEMEAIGRSESFTLGKGGGAGGGDPANWVDSAKWKETLAAAVHAGQDPPVGRLATFKLEQMSYPELVKCWSVVDFLVKKDAEKFRAFLAGTKERDKEEETALKEAYGFDYRGLEAEWRKFVDAGFRVP